MAVSKASQEKANEIFILKFKNRGLPPRNAGILKGVMAAAIQKGEKPVMAAKAYLKEKGLTLAEPKEEPPAAPEEEKEAKPEKAEKKVAKSEKKEEKPQKEEFEKSKIEIDRKILDQTLRVLARAGINGVSLEGKDNTDDNLRKQLHGAIMTFAGSKQLAMLERMKTADEKGLDALGDCIGVFVDLRSSDCAACADQPRCVGLFMSNTKDGFKSILAKSGVEPMTVMATRSSGEKKEEKKPFVERSKVEAFADVAADSEAWVVVFDIENPEKAGLPPYGFVEQVLKHESMQVKDLRKIFSTYWNGLKPSGNGVGDGPLSKEVIEGQAKTDRNFLVALEHLEAAGVACVAKRLPDDMKKQIPKSQRKQLGI